MDVPLRPEVLRSGPTTCTEPSCVCRFFRSDESGECLARLFGLSADLGVASLMNMRNQRCTAVEDTTLALRPGDWPSAPESLALTPPSSAGGRPPLAELSGNITTTMGGRQEPWDWQMKSEMHHSLSTLRCGNAAFDRKSFRLDHPVMKNAARWAYGPLRVDYQLAMMKSQGEILARSRRPVKDDITVANDCFPLDWLEEHDMMELHHTANDASAPDLELLKALIASNGPRSKHDYVWMIGQEGGLYRALYLVDDHFNRLAVLKMWAVVMHRICGWDAVDDIMWDIERLNQFNPTDFACVKAETEGFKAYEYMVLSKVALERTWLKAIEAVCDIRSLVMPSVKWDFACCGMHGTGCRNAPSFPGSAKTAAIMQMPVYANDDKLVGIVFDGFNYV